MSYPAPLGLLIKVFNILQRSHIKKGWIVWGLGKAQWLQGARFRGCLSSRSVSFRSEAYPVASNVFLLSKFSCGPEEPITKNPPKIGRVFAAAA